MLKTCRSRLTVILPVAALVALVAAPLAADYKLERKVRTAGEVIDELLATPDRSVPERLLDQSRCIAVFPGVIKGAFGFGGRHGKGVVSCRQEGGEWSPPLFLKISGGSFGLQIGAESTDLVLFFLSERGARSLLESKFTLGADVGVAAGPAGRSAEASTDLKLKAEIYSYARSRGLFAGLSLEGARLSADQRAMQRYYGKRIWPEEILFEGAVPDLPAEAREFVDRLP